MSKDLVDPCVDLHVTQLHREGMARTTWPWVHPQGNRPLMERLNLVAEKGL
jgi:hypothetical protein